MKKRFLKILFIAFFSFSLPLIVEAQEKTPLVLYFRFDKAVVESEYLDNSLTLRYLDEIFSDTLVTTRIDSIIILSSTSPEGKTLYNDCLAGRRSLAVKNYLVSKYPQLNDHNIYLHPQGENWREFRRLIEADNSLPSRDEVLRIINNTSDTERCKASLKELAGGVPYHYIRRHLSRYLRNAVVCMVWEQTEHFPELPSPVALDVSSEECFPVKLSPLSREKKYTSSSCAPVKKRPLFALKTNLLFDAALMPNIEIEVPIGRRWSLNGEYMFPWWLFDSDKYCMQILMGGLEGRYWLGNRTTRNRKEVLTGHFLGLYAGGGKYDLQWDSNGYQGEFFIAAGISYGWAARIARNLRLEMTLGVGLLRTDYRHYHARDNYKTLLWQENGKYTWFGPTKAKVSLVWMINKKMKKGGRK